MVEKLFRKFEQIHIDDVSRVQNRPRSIRPLCKHGPIYIYMYIYFTRGWIFHPTTPLQTFDGKHDAFSNYRARTRILERRRSADFAASIVISYERFPRGFLSNCEKEGRGHAPSTFNPLATFFSRQCFPSRRGARNCVGGERQGES